MANGVNVAGFKGTVNDERWARLVPRAGSNPYGVVNVGDCKVTATTGDRRVSVAPTSSGGGVWGWGVFCEFAEATPLSLSAPGSGSRWDLIALRRNWTTRTVTPVVVPGSATKQIPTRRTNPGVEDDQPIALVRVQAGITSIMEIIDLRCFSSGGGVLAMDITALEYLNYVGASVRIQHTTHTRMVDASGNLSWSRTVAGGAIGYTASSFREPTTANGTIATIQVPYPGYPFHIFAHSTIEAGGGGVGTRWNMDLLINGTVVDGARGDVVAPWFQVKGNSWGASTASSTVAVRASRYNGTGVFGISTWNKWFTVLIVPAHT